MCLATLHRSVTDHSERDQGAPARGTHTGTHLGALGHYSRSGRLHGGVEAAAVQTKTGGLATRGIEEAAPQIRRAVLLDVAAGATTFLLAVLPLKLQGATGSPVRPVAIL